MYQLKDKLSEWVKDLVLNCVQEKSTLNIKTGNKRNRMEKQTGICIEWIVMAKKRAGPRQQKWGALLTIKLRGKA